MGTPRDNSKGHLKGHLKRYSRESSREKAQERELKERAQRESSRERALERELRTESSKEGAQERDIEREIDRSINTKKIFKMQHKNMLTMKANYFICYFSYIFIVFLHKELIKVLQMFIMLTVNHQL